MIATAAGTGHPIWHFAVVAGAALAVFIGIKGWELWEAHRVRPTRPMLLLAAASVGAAGVHLTVTAEHFREAFIFGVFFIAAASAQAAWAVGMVFRPTSRLLRVGLAGNAAVITLWAVTRTVGLPVGPQVWKPETVSTADGICTLLEIGVVVGCAWLLSPRTSTVSRPTPSTLRAHSAR